MRRNNIFISIFFLLLLFTSAIAENHDQISLKLYAANNPDIQYTGRIDYSNPKEPKLWNAGSYIRFRYKGKTCEVILKNQDRWGKYHNYLEVKIAGEKPYRIQTTGRLNHIVIGKGLTDKVHTVMICKDTESLIGYIQIRGIRCDQLLTPPKKPSRKMEFIGDSITSGTGSDLSKVSCGKGQWYDQQNAYMSYGPATARLLDSQWILSSVSGIGMIHSCCKMTIVMPQVFEKLDLSDDSLSWNFKKYQPDIVTICLGQNDGIQDSVKFCGAYADFIHQLRGVYPKAHIICLTSPMADPKLRSVLKRYLTGIVGNVRHHGDENVYKYFFPRSYNKGCGGHPVMAQHQVIARELADYIKSKFNW